MSWVMVGGAAISVVGNVAGTAMSKQKAPKTAPFVPVDAQAEQLKSLEGNLANQGRIEQLISRANSYTQDQALSLTEKAIPGYSKLAQQMMSVGTENMMNPYKLPTEVEQNLVRIAAERGINTGVRGQAGDFSLLRDLGVNSLEYGNARISQAQQLFQTVASMAPRVNPMSPLAFYITPQQQLQATVDNNTGQRSTQQAAYNAQAGADNHNRAMWGQMISNTTGMIGGMVSGAGKGGIT